MPKFVLISDTHTKHRQLNMPEGDILIHCGDITYTGELDVIQDFNKWLGELNYKHTIVIFGNHELKWPQRSFEYKQTILSNAIYLEDSEITIDGIKFYGSPWQPYFFSWAWNFPENKKEYKEFAINTWNKIPDDVDVLITHGPPYGILDKTNTPNQNEDPHVGCKYLLKRVNELKNLKLHIMGHLHESRNLIKINNTIFVNASTLDENYDIVREPIVIDL